jgi:hypothetical protein
VNEDVPYLHVAELVLADAPLLTYALLPFPNPLLASGPAQLTLVVSNGTTQFITVASIAVTLPVGTTAKNLTASPTGIGTTVPSGWNASAAGGVFTLTPATPEVAKVGPNGLSFIFTGIAVNDEPGTCTIGITEDASSPSKPRASRTSGIPVAKFPATFALSELSATPLSVVSGGSAVVLWNGSPATYVLSYDPDGNGTVPHVVGPNGPYTAPNLTAPVVVFTLTARVTVPGQDAPLVIQRQAVVTVVAGSVAFTALPSIVGTKGVTRLSWLTTGTTSCTLDPGGISIPPNGYAYAVVNQTTVFTIVATIAGRQPIAAQQTVTVNPSIVAKPSANVVSLVAKDGGIGQPGSSGFAPGEGGPGGPGDPITSTTITVGPLDAGSSPAAVKQIVYRGGTGGRGGPGGNATGGEESGPAGRGGPGGQGGDATGRLTIRLDPSAAPQQLIVDVGPGTGGPGGTGGYSDGMGRAPDGRRGDDGKNLAELRFEES